jgi:hypothetical protein
VTESFRGIPSGVFSVHYFALKFICTGGKITQEEERTYLIERAIDDNDIELTRLEVKTTSMSQRVDTYTLESALFAALAFSGFLTLFTSDITTIGEVELFLSTIGKVLLLELPINNIASTMLNKANIEAMLIIETLVCSLFFIFVIVTRLRFTRLLEDIKYEIKEGRVYNAKEEEVHTLILDKNEGNIHTPNIINRRLENLNKEIVKNIGRANELLPEFKSILDWMKVCRDIGIGTFITILITSALLMSNVLALIFLTLSILAYTYTTLDDFLKNKKRSITKRSLREQGD